MVKGKGYFRSKEKGNTPTCCGMSTIIGIKWLSNFVESWIMVQITSDK